MIKIIKDDIDYRKCFIEEVAPVVLWGAGIWSDFFLRDSIIEISDICDADEKKHGKRWGNYIVLSPEELEDKYKNRKLYILNSFGISLSIQDGLYIMLCKYDFDAKIINLHSNIGFDLYSDYFDFLGKRIQMISHIHNCGYRYARRSERTIEVAMAKEWFSKYPNNVIEIGAVTPYYFPNMIKEVVDPADNHKFVTVNKSIFEVDLNDKNVICISTVEHIGTGQYGVAEKRNSEMAIEKILSESAHCLITTPIGENFIVDNYLKEHYMDDSLTVYMRKFYGNGWEVIDKNRHKSEDLIDYCKEVACVYEKRDLLGANCGLIVITK